MIKDFRALLDNTLDAIHLVVLYSGTWECMKHKSHHKTYISDELLHAMEHCIYHGIKVEVEGLDGERISQMCRCTASQSWHEGDQWNDWEWVKQPTVRCYGAVNGHLPWQLQRRFKIKLLNKDGAFIECWFALALTTISDKMSNLDPVSKFVQVRNAPAGVALQCFSVGNIIGCAHGNAEIATSSKTADRWNERWIVSGHLHLATWNDVDNL
jgi:hypothetical protein